MARNPRNRPIKPPSEERTDRLSSRPGGDPTSGKMQHPLFSYRPEVPNNPNIGRGFHGESYGISGYPRNEIYNKIQYANVRDFNDQVTEILAFSHMPLNPFTELEKEYHKSYLNLIKSHGGRLKRFMGIYDSNRMQDIVGRPGSSGSFSSKQLMDIYRTGNIATEMEEVTLANKIIKNPSSSAEQLAHAQRVLDTYKPKGADFRRNPALYEREPGRGTVLSTGVQPLSVENAAVVNRTADLFRQQFVGMEGDPSSETNELLKEQNKKSNESGHTLKQMLHWNKFMAVVSMGREVGKLVESVIKLSNVGTAQWENYWEGQKRAWDVFIGTEGAMQWAQQTQWATKESIENARKWRETYIPALNNAITDTGQPGFMPSGIVFGTPESVIPGGITPASGTVPLTQNQIYSDIYDRLLQRYGEEYDTKYLNSKNLFTQMNVFFTLTSELRKSGDTMVTNADVQSLATYLRTCQW